MCARTCDFLPLWHLAAIRLDSRMRIWPSFPTWCGRAWRLKIQLSALIVASAKPFGLADLFMTLYGYVRTIGVFLFVPKRSLHFGQTGALPTLPTGLAGFASAYYKHYLPWRCSYLFFCFRSSFFAIFLISSLFCFVLPGTMPFVALCIMLIF